MASKVVQFGGVFCGHLYLLLWHHSHTVSSCGSDGRINDDISSKMPLQIVLISFPNLHAIIVYVHMFLTQIFNRIHFAFIASLVAFTDYYYPYYYLKDLN